MSFKALVLTLAATVAACGGFERGDPSPEDDSTDGDASGDADGGQSFATSVFPILSARCTACHGPGGVGASSQMRLSGDTATDYETVLALVDVRSPANSRLLQEASGQGHGGGTVLASDSTDYRTVLAWITGGASP